MQGTADGVHQVRLAHAHAAVDEQGIVALRRAAGHRFGGGVRKLVARTDDEILEREPGVERGLRELHEHPAIALLRQRSAESTVPNS